MFYTHPTRVIALHAPIDRDRVNEHGDLKRPTGRYYYATPSPYICNAFAPATPEIIWNHHLQPPSPSDPKTVSKTLHYFGTMR